MIIELERNGVAVELMFGKTYLDITVTPAYASSVFTDEQNTDICDDVSGNIKRLAGVYENELASEHNLSSTYIDVASKLIGYMLRSMGYVIKSTI